METPAPVYFDLETRLISPDGQPPRPVSLAWAVGDGPVHLALFSDPAAWLYGVREILRPGRVAVAFNGAAFDLPVLWLWGTGGLQGALWRALEEGRAVDPMITDRLVRHGAGRHAPTFRGLAACCEETCKLHVEKADTWRLRYQELEATPLDQWPAEAIRYARDDVEALRTLHKEHARRGWIGLCGEAGTYARDMAEQCRAAFAFKLLSLPGVPVDRDVVEGVWAPLWARRRDDARAVAMAAGLVRPDGTRDTKAAERMAAGFETFSPVADRLEALHRERESLLRTVPYAQVVGPTEHGGEPLHPRLEAINREGQALRSSVWRWPRTEKGAYSITDTTTADALARTPEGHPQRRNAEALVALTEYARTSGVLLGDGVKTGRLAELRAGGRYSYRTRYDTLKETNRTGAAGLAGKKDPTSLGGNFQNLPGDYDLAPAERLRHCFRAPPGWVFVDSDFAQLELYTLAQCCLQLIGYSRLAEVLLAGKDPHRVTGAAFLGITYEESLALGSKFKPTRNRAKPFNFGVPGGMGAARFVAHAWDAYGVRMTEEEFKRDRALYFGAYPEVREYMARQGDLQAVEVPISGYRRGGVGYCDACNTPFQSLGASAAKAATWAVVAAAYHREGPLRRLGAFPVAMIHDQILTLCPEEHGAEVAELQTRLMETHGSRFTPSVPLKVETTLCYTYNKGMDPVRDGAGRLVPGLVPGEQPRHSDPALHGPWIYLAR